MRTTRISIRTRKSLSELIAQTKNKRVILTKDGKAIAVLMSVDEFRSMVAMIELSGNLEKLKEIYAIHEKVQSGDLSDFEQKNLK